MHSGTLAAKLTAWSFGDSEQTMGAEGMSRCKELMMNVGHLAVQEIDGGGGRQKRNLVAQAALGAVNAEDDDARSKCDDDGGGLG